jgi:hypothetical protein
MKYWTQLLKRFATPHCLALALLVFFAPMVLAQETTGGIQGTVKDPSGAVVPKARVVVSSPALAGTKQVASDGTGYYRFTNLPPGMYAITVTAEGFKTSKRDGLVIQVGHLPTVDIDLQLGAAATTVEVTEAAPVIDTTTTQNLTNLGAESLQNLPTGTSFQSVIEMAPMAHNEPLSGYTGGTGGSMPGSSGNGRSVGYSIGGAADSESSYLVEGQDTENISGGFSKADVPMDFIQEVQIKTSGVSAEYGGALGGVVNVIMKKGSNDFHGGLFTSYQGAAADANQHNPVLRYNPNGDGATATQDPNIEFYQRKADSYSILQPGAFVGGPILKDKLWFFAGLAPIINSTSREVDFGAPSSVDPLAGKLNFSQNSKTYYTTGRLDFVATQKIRLFGSWLYQDERELGDTLPGADPINSQSSYLNDAITSPVNSYAYDYGYSAPNSTWNFGADITLTQKLVSTTRFGYFFENYHDFGWPTTGVNLSWLTSGTGVDNTGAALPDDLAKTTGASTVAYNQTYTKFNANKHVQFNQDFSYYISTKNWGTHNVKAGYQLNHLSNVINQNGNVPLVNIIAGAHHNHSAGTATGGDNCTLLGNEWVYTNSKGKVVYPCTGQYGYAEVQDFSTILTTPVVDWNHAFYAHDAWTLGHGLTLDLGLRIEKESLPAPAGYKVSAIAFSWKDKFEPRLGIAWDPTQKGKMKVFGSYGVVNDVMKLLIAQTSWGAQAYEDCYYPLGPDGTASKFVDSDIDATFKSSRACPNGPATTGANFTSGATPSAFIDAGTSVGLIENVNWRPWEPVAPNVKPYRQHEYVAGFQYELKPGYSFSARYDRRRLDHVIEDASLSDVNFGETYAIVNPGEGVNKTIDSYATYLASIGEAFGVPGWSFDLADFGTCTTCPANPKAVRNYDALELSLAMNPSTHWSGSVSYTYSSLWGNYTGLTTTDQIDGGAAGRNSPDTTRAFDEPFYYFKADGTSSNGPLPTDRPNAFKGNVYYAHPWGSKHTTSIGLNQNILQGSPVSSFIDLAQAQGNPVQATYIWGRGNWVDASADSNGLITLGTPHVRRTPWFLQSDISVSHTIKVGEHKTVKFEFTGTNALNQHAVVAYWAGLDSNYWASPLSPTNTAEAVPAPITMYDGVSLYHTLETGYTSSLPSAMSSVIKDSQYGQPNLWQQPRNTRFEVHYNF